MDLRPLINPTGESFLATARRIFDQRTDLQDAFGTVEDLGFQKWLAVHGSLEYPDHLGGLYPPVPPKELRATACGGPTAQTHLQTSLEDFLAVVELWETYSRRPITELARHRTKTTTASQKAPRRSHRPVRMLNAATRAPAMKKLNITRLTGSVDGRDRLVSVGGSTLTQVGRSPTKVATISRASIPPSVS